MTILGGVIVFYVLSVVIGRHVKHVSVKVLLLLALFAAFQVGIVLHQLYTLEYPIG